MTPAGPPPLDTRDLPALLAQLRASARQALPAWTPPPEGDAGSALHRIFARFVEIALKRLGGVPDKVLLTFLDTMGVSRLPPAPARVPLVFSLAPGSAPALVPAGVQASAPASGTTPAVTFETEQDLLVLPARLVAARTVDPVWDRESDLTDLVTGPGRGPVAPRRRSAFVGDTPMPHVLHVGEDGTLDVTRDVVFALGFSYRSGAPADQVQSFLRSLVLSCRSGGADRVLLPTVVFGADDAVYFEGVLPPVDEQTLDGIGLPSPATSRWLQLRLPSPFPDAAVPADLLMQPKLLDVEAGNLRPDAVLAGTAPLDPTKDFLPFGERPQVGDAFLIRSDQAFQQPMTVSLSFQVSAGTASPDLRLVWEYLTQDGWSAVTASPAGATLTGGGQVDLTMPPVPLQQVGGQAGRWVRVRIAAGGYGAPAEYVPVDPANPAKGFAIKPGTGNLAPPRLTSLALSYAARTVPRCVVQSGGYHHAAVQGEEFAPFPALSELPAPYADSGPALYLGFDGLQAQQPVTLYADVPAAEFTRPGLAAPTATGTQARMQWQYYDGMLWRELTVFDGTRELTASGTVSLITPPDLAELTRFEPQSRAWLRVLSPANDPVASPRLTAVHLNAVPAIAAVTVADESLGSSSGQPAQVFVTARQPVQPGQRLLVAEPEALAQDEAAALATEEGPDAVVAQPDPTGAEQILVRWHEVPNLVTSGPTSRHYTLDRATGTVRFGDGLHGMIPPRGTANVSVTYRCGGGSSGNLPPATVVQLATPVPGLATVTNPVAADGGADEESTDAVRERGAHVLRHRDRAVAAGDVEWLARQAAGTRVARAVCLPNLDRAFAPDPGWLSVLVIPAGDVPTPRPTPGLLREVGDYLTARSAVSLASPPPGRISVIGPAYLRVTVEADVVPRVLADADQVTARIVAALGAFFHPVSGGPDGTGWALGRAVYTSEVAQVLDNVDGVSYVKTLALHANLVQRRLRLDAAPAPVAPARLPTGSTVRTADRLLAGQLAQTIPAGTLAGRVDVTGFREGDRVTFAADLTVAADPGSAGPIPAALTGGRLATGFPRGSVVLSAGGTHQTRLRQGLRPDPAARAPGPVLHLELDDVPPLAAGDRLTVLYPFPATILSVSPESPGGFALAVDPVQIPAVLPGGTIVATLDDRVRAPLAADQPADPDGSVGRLVMSDFGPGQPVVLSPPGAEEPSLPAIVDNVEAVSDLVHLDPYVFAYSAGHRIRISAT